VSRAAERDVTQTGETNIGRGIRRRGSGERAPPQRRARTAPTSAASDPRTALPGVRPSGGWRVAAGLRQPSPDNSSSSTRSSTLFPAQLQGPAQGQQFRQTLLARPTLAHPPLELEHGFAVLDHEPLVTEGAMLLQLAKCNRSSCLEPAESLAHDGPKRVIDDLGQIRAVDQHVPDFVTIMAIGAENALQAFAVRAQCLWPARCLGPGEGFKPWLLDRLGQMRSLSAFPLAGSHPTCSVGLQRSWLVVSRVPQMPRFSANENGVQPTESARLALKD